MPRRLGLICMCMCLLTVYSKAQMQIKNSYQSTLVSVTQTGNVGIGTTDPAAKLDVNGLTKTGTIQITGGTPSVGKLLTANDATGNAVWQSLGIPYQEVAPNSTDYVEVSTVNGWAVIPNTSLTVATSGTYLILATYNAYVRVAPGAITCYVVKNSNYNYCYAGASQVIGDTDEFNYSFLGASLHNYHIAYLTAGDVLDLRIQLWAATTGCVARAHQRYSKVAVIKLSN
jgi:hypothetical protein